MALPKIETPKFSCTLPLSGVRVDFRPFLSQEERVLLMASESKSPAAYLTAMKDVCRVCTYDKIDIDNLASVDLEFLFLNLRMRAVGETVAVSKECANAECKNKLQHNILLDDIKASNITEFNENKKIDIGDGVGVIMRSPTADSIAELELSELTQAEKMYLMIGMSIESIYDSEQMYKPSDYTKEEIADFIDQIPLPIMQNIGKFFENQPKLVYHCDTTCNKCSAPNTFKLEGMADFFT